MLLLNVRYHYQIKKLQSESSVSTVVPDFSPNKGEKKDNPVDMKPSEKRREEVPICGGRRAMYSLGGVKRRWESVTISRQPIYQSRPRSRLLIRSNFPRELG